MSIKIKPKKCSGINKAIYFKGCVKETLNRKEYKIMKKVKMLIGIDPDTEKSGVAVKNGKLIESSNLTFFQLFEFLSF